MTAPAGFEVSHRYRVLDQLGAGGMGVVYRALDRLTGDIVALKQVAVESESPTPVSGNQTGIPAIGENDLTQTAPAPASDPALSPDREKMRELAKEFETLSSLRHPNIISVLDYGFDRQAGPYYTMELLEAPQTFLDAARGKPTVRKVVLIVQLLRALSYLHRRRVLHLDLKPANVLVVDEVKILDFGLATQRGELREGLAGTPTHISPEVLRGETPGVPADLYAVGVMAYQAFGGRHPFDCSSTRTLINDHLNVEPDLEQLDASDGLKEVIRGLLRKNSAERWQRADEVIDALVTAAEVGLSRETRATRESFLQRADFVDRHEERGTLLRALSQVKEGRGGIVLIEGASGLGKSRLLEELRTEAMVRGVGVVTGRASEHGEAFHLWQEALRSLALSTDLNDDEAARLQILIPDLSSLLEREIPEFEPDPQSARNDLVEVMSTVFARREEPTLIVLEDLHFALESAEILGEFFETLASVPLLIVASFRGEEAVGLAERIPTAEVLQLGPLGTGDIEQLCESMLGTKGSSSEVVGFLEHHTEGNAFFIVETVRALAEEAGALGEVVNQDLPERIDATGVQAVVGRRLSLVSEEHKSLLECAAVLGRYLDPKVLESAMGRDLTASGLPALIDLALVEVRDNRWRFTHDNFRESVLAGISAENRRRYHLALARAIESVPSGIGEEAAQLAYHFGAAGEVAKEREYTALAGMASLRRGAYAQAVSLLERAQELQSDLSALAPEKELDQLLHLGSAQIAVYSFSASQVRETYEQAAALAQKVGQPSKVAPSLIGLSKFHFVRGELELSRRLARRCLELAKSSGDAIAHQHARLMIGEAGVWLGEFADDRHYTEEVLDLYEPDQGPLHLSLYGQDPRATAAVQSTIGNWMLGYNEEALEMSRQAREWAQEDENPFSISIAYQVSAWLRQLRGEIDETHQDAQVLGRLADEHGFPLFGILARGFAGWALVKSGEADGGIQQIRGVMNDWLGLGARLALSYFSTLMADACLEAGRLDEGLSVVCTGLDGSLETEERCYLPELHRLEGALHLAGGDPERARAALERGMESAREQRARSFGLRIAIDACHLEQAEKRAGVGHEFLEELVGWLEDKGDTPELTEAKRLLGTDLFEKGD